jgi:hypothetical protein
LVENGPFPGGLAAASALTCLTAGAIALDRFPLGAAAAPVAAAAVGFAASLWLIAHYATEQPLPGHRGRELDPAAALLYGGTLSLALLAGEGPATALLAGGGFYWLARRPPGASIAIGLMAGIAAAAAAGSASLP